MKLFTFAVFTFMADARELEKSFPAFIFLSICMEKEEASGLGKRHKHGGRNRAYRAVARDV